MALKAGVLEVVLGDHERIRTLFESISQTSRDEKKHRDLYGDLRRELTRHAMLQEEVIIPHLRTESRTRELGRIVAVQQAATERLVTNLDKTSRQDPYWDSLLKQLQAHVSDQMLLVEQQVLYCVKGIPLNHNSPYLQSVSFGRKIREKAARYRYSS